MSHWINKIATCSHAGSELFFRVQFKQFRVCERCTRLMGWNGQTERWIFLGIWDGDNISKKVDELKAQEHKEWLRKFRENQMNECIEQLTQLRRGDQDKPYHTLNLN
ncbi:MAG TPA: hypothetical protein VMW95_03720 [Desulfobacterales bacterium]|nr:hypothetical protein [Desulfobacterales bacterium]